MYNGLADSLTHADADVAQLGRRIVLPSSYTGGDRYIQQRFQNSMAITRRLQKPALFITFTANPRWPKICEQLFPGQNADSRPDITSQVF